MMNKLKTLSLFAFVLLIGFTSCDSDDDETKSDSSLTKTEAKQKIATFNTAASNDLDGIADAEGLKTFQDLFDLMNIDDPYGRTTDNKKIRTFLKQKGQALKKVFGPAVLNGGRVAGSEPFDFEASKGVYAWDADLERFEKIDDADIIVIQFPTEGSATNNGKLEIAAYEEVETYDEEFEETVYQLSHLDASIYKGATKVASVFLEAEWDEDGAPLSMDIVLRVDPFKLDIVLDDNGTTTSQFSVTLLRNQDVLVAVSATVKYKDSSKSEESAEKIDGYVQVKNLKLSGTIDFDAANGSPEVDWNKIVKTSLYDDNKKLGDIVFEDEDGAFVAYLKYNDGSKEKLETALEPVWDKINELRGDLGVE